MPLVEGNVILAQKKNTHTHTKKTADQPTRKTK